MIFKWAQVEIDLIILLFFLFVLFPHISLVTVLEVPRCICDKQEHKYEILLEVDEREGIK